MYEQVGKQLENKTRARVVKDAICSEQLIHIGTEKDPIRRNVRFSLE
jgi:hypothetical protein